MRTSTERQATPAPHDFATIPPGTTFTARFCDDSGETRFHRGGNGLFLEAGDPEEEAFDDPDWFGDAGYFEWRACP